MRGSARWTRAITVTVATLHEFRSAVIAPRFAAFAIVLRLSRRPTTIAICACRFIAMTALGMAIGMTMLVRVLSTVLTTRFASVVFRTMMLARCVVTATFTIGVVRPGILLLRATLFPVAPLAILVRARAVDALFVRALGAILTCRARGAPVAGHTERSRPVVGVAFVSARGIIPVAGSVGAGGTVTVTRGTATIAGTIARRPSWAGATL